MAAPKAMVAAHTGGMALKKDTARRAIAVVAEGCGYDSRGGGGIVAWISRSMSGWNFDRLDGENSLRRSTKHGSGDPCHGGCSVRDRGAVCGNAAGPCQNALPHLLLIHISEPTRPA